MKVMLAVQDRGRETDARAIWQAFEAAVSGCPIPHTHQDQPISWDFVGCPWKRGMFASGELFLRGRPAARICLTEAFFQLTRVESQIAILLHEAIHIRLFGSRLQANYQVIKNPPGRPDDDDSDAIRSRWDLAMDCLMFVQEVGADRYLQTHREQYANCWAPYFNERFQQFYCPDGPTALEEGGDAHPLRPYRTFYRLLRTELGLMLVDDPGRQRALTERRDRLVDRLRELAPDDATRLIGSVQSKVLSIRVDTEEPDPETYTDLCGEVLRVPLPNA